MGMTLATRHGFFYRLTISRTKKCLTSQPNITFRHQLQHQHQPQPQHQHVAFFSQTAYQDPTLTWAQSNPGLAQECLNPPPIIDSSIIDRRSSLAENKMQSLEAYLEWRRWSLLFPNEIIDQSRNEVSGDQRENAKALISHLLSAPLTLASQLKHLTEKCGKLCPSNNNNNNNNNNNIMELELCCVGARAEASIPTVYWKEFLMLSTASLLSSEGNTSGGGGSFPEYNESSSLQVSLDFIGPDIPPKLSEQSVSININNNNNNNSSNDNKDDDNYSSVSSTLSLRGYHRGYFHDSPAATTTTTPSKSWDAYIFFNPGFGHPNLRKSWESTLKLILDKGRKTRVEKSSVLLLTAHSEKDAMRDATVLGDVYGLNNVEYHENPFASRVAYEDPFEKQHFVRPNHYVATVLM